MALEAENVIKMAKKPKKLWKWLRSPKRSENGWEAQYAQKMDKKPKC